MSPHAPGRTQFFLCYARKDLAFAQQLTAQLRRRASVWYDIDGISGGASLGQATAREGVGHARG
jgi:hypothetical protein